MTSNPSPERRQAVYAGALAARDGVHRSENPHPIESETWSNWMDGFDHQTAWLLNGRGTYDPFAADASSPHEASHPSD